jgi:hypothetical protein
MNEELILESLLKTLVIFMAVGMAVLVVVSLWVARPWSFLSVAVFLGIYRVIRSREAR